MTTTTYDNTNSGALFKNDEKASEKHPDYRGTLNVEGRAFWISAWLKTSKQGKPFLSLAVTAKDTRPDNNKPSARATDSLIPF